MTDLYPENIGIQLEKNILPLKEVEKLKKNLPNNLIIRFYGLAGVGKGTTSKAVSELLEIPYVEGSFILRAATYIYRDLNLEITKENTDLVFDKINLRINSDNRLQIVYNGKPLDHRHLKNSIIDMHVTDYSGDGYVRQKYYEKLGNFISHEIDSPCVLDSRGALPPYILQAKTAGKPVIQIMLIVSDEVAAARYHNHQIDQKRKANPDFVETEEEEQKIYDQFKKDITERNQKDLVMYEKMGLGVVEPESGIIDTSDMVVDEVIGTVLTFVESKAG